MADARREPTLEELLSDPMMALLFDHSGTTADAVRALMREARRRLEMAAARHGADDQSGKAGT